MAKKTKIEKSPEQIAKEYEAMTQEIRLIRKDLASVNHAIDYSLKDSGKKAALAVHYINGTGQWENMTPGMLSTKVYNRLKSVLPGMLKEIKAELEEELNVALKKMKEIDG